VGEPATQASWALAGDAIVTLVARHGRLLGDLPPGLEPLPGPALVVAARYQTSPIGSFCELTFLEPARRGARPGWAVTLSVVNDARATTGARRRWAAAGELGELYWRRTGRVVRLDWGDRRLRISAVQGRAVLPVLLRARVLEWSPDGPITVPVRLRGLGHPAVVHMEVPEGDHLRAIHGRHRGLVVASQQLRIEPARAAPGLTRSLTASLRRAEPGVAGTGLAHHHGRAAPLLRSATSV